jgi:potassium efflux system protein
VITTFDRKELVVPNKEFVTKQVINWSLSDSVVRVEIPVGIAYGADVDAALAKLVEVARAHEHVLEDPKPRALFLGFAADRMNLELRVFSPDVEHTLSIRHDLHVAIERAFREAKIPFVPPPAPPAPAAPSPPATGSPPAKPDRR